MPESKEKKSYTLNPSWKQFFWGYVISILLIPVAGLGLAGLYFIRKKHKSLKYIVTDTQISSIDARYRRNIDLVNIDKIEIRQSWLQEKLGIGNLTLHTSASEMEVIGMEQPSRLKQMMEQAILAEIQRRKEMQKTKPREPKYKPGSMDKMEYLTGLWQQGLISDEDFEKERKHFE